MGNVLSGAAETVLSVACLLRNAVGVAGVTIFLMFISYAESLKMPFLKGYQLERIMAWLYPDEYSTSTAYQQLNSIMAIGSGMLLGKGYKNNEITSVKNGNFYSEAQTDFIFAVIGEEFGFKGSVFVVVLLVLITLECFSVGRRAKDLSGQIICAGVGGLIPLNGGIQNGFHIAIVATNNLIGSIPLFCQILAAPLA